MDYLNVDSKKKCCIPSCPGSLVMHRFPKDPVRLQTWLSVIDNPDLKKLHPGTLHNNRRVCSLHFDVNCYVRNAGRKLLKKEALPSLRLNVFKKDEPSTPSNKDVSDSTSAEPKGYTSMVIVNENEDTEEEHRESVGGSKYGRMANAKLEEPFQAYNELELERTTHLSTICKEEPAMSLSDSSPRQSPLLASDDADPTQVNDQMCRLCLSEEPGMWSFFSVLTFEDQSTLDVAEVFQFLTGETVQQVENSELPTKICRSCVNLLVNAYNFQQRYEKTKVILSKYLSKNEDGNQPHAADNESSTFSNVIEKIEPIEFDVEPSGFSVQSDDSESEKADFVDEDNKIPKLHRCPICPQMFTALELKQHCRSHTALKRYFSGAPKYNRKVRFYAKPRTKNVCLFYREKVLHSCPFCSKEFDAIEFKTHVKEHRKEGNFKCNVCHRIFLGRNHLKMHQLSHKKEAPFKCQNCGKGFFQQKNFDFHMLRHTSPLDLPYKCQYCGRAFSNPEHLKRHTFSHEKHVSYQQYYKPYNAPLKCKQCLQKFKTESLLESHTCRLSCAKCRKTFDKRKDYIAHECEYKTKLSQCDPCGKVFRTSSERQHKYRCASRLLCYVCGKNVTNMTQHMQSHYPQKRSYVPCPHCPKQFRDKHALSRHVNQVHMTDVPFRCQYCPKGFKSRWNLTVHERTHTGVKEHTCNICDKGFVEKSYLKRHQWKVHFKMDYKNKKDADASD